MDNTGKTTLVNHLSEKFGLEIVKSPGPQRYREMFEFVDMYITKMEVFKEKGLPEEYPFIHDRFPIFSDRAYSMLRSINPFEELDEGKWLYERLYRVGPTLVYCRPSTDTILKFKDGREQMKGVVDNAKELLQRYDHLIFQWEKRMGSSLYKYSYEERPSGWISDLLQGRGYKEVSDSGKHTRRESKQE